MICLYVHICIVFGREETFCIQVFIDHLTFVFFAVVMYWERTGWVELTKVNAGGLTHCSWRRWVVSMLSLFCVCY